MLTEEKPTGKVDLDYILENHLGQLGWYQKRNVLLLALPVMFVSFGAEFIFSVSKLNTRCFIPECDGPSTELKPIWLLDAIPGSSLDNFDNCNRYVVKTNISVITCSADMFDHNRSEPCKDYVYDRTNSAVYDFGLECDEWRRTLAGTLNSIGSLLVLPITGYISDRWGRRVALCINAINIAWTGFLRAFSVNYEMYSALHFIGAFAGSGTFSTSYILATELVGPRYRVPVGATISTLFATGQVALGLIAWAVPSWRTLCMVLFGPQIIVIAYFWILAESVRWLISKNNYDEAKKVLLRAAEVNKTEIPNDVIESLILNIKIEKEKKKKLDDVWLITHIIKSPTMLRRCCTTPIWWMTTTFVYYGLSINSVSLAGNMYLNYVIVSAIEIPGFWIAISLLNRIGRKITLCLGFLTCAICCIAFPFIPNDLPNVSLFLFLLGKLAISLVFTSLYIYTAELYPTRYRHSLLGFSSMVGRIGSITAPLTPALMIYWEGIPSIMFGTMATISCLLVLTTPETLGSTLPNTIEESEAIGRNKPV